MEDTYIKHVILPSGSHYIQVGENKGQKVGYAFMATFPKTKLVAVTDYFVGDYAFPKAGVYEVTPVEAESVMSVEWVADE